MKHNVLDLFVRKQIIEEILQEENQRRKEESLRRYEIYKQNQKRFILQSLVNEFSPKTVSKMRTLTSINLTKRIIDQKSSIYRDAPLRTFMRFNGANLTENEIKQCESIYKVGGFNVNFKTANRLFKLQSDQIHLQCVPQNRAMALRVLMPHHLDVVPSKENPELGEVFITSVMDTSRLLTNMYQDLQGSQFNDHRDLRDQQIADPDDMQKRAKMKFVWWTDEFNLTTNGLGEYTNEFNQEIEVQNPEIEFANPIGKAPFVDVSAAKDYEYWLRSGSSVCDFAVEMGVMLSDLSNTMRLNGHIQGVVYSEKQPGTIAVGPNVFIHIPLDPDKAVQPRLEMLSPTAQIEQQMSTLESLISLLVAAEGLDSKSIGGMAGGQTYSSAIERLLALMERFEASRDDIDAFSKAESQVFEIAKLWSNLYQNTTNEQTGQPYFVEDLAGGVIPEDTRMSVAYAKPEEMMSDKDRTDMAVVQLNEGLITRAQAISMIHDIPLQQAEKMVVEIERDMGLGKKVSDSIDEVEEDDELQDS